MHTTEYIDGGALYAPSNSGPQSELDIALNGVDPKFDAWGFPNHTSEFSGNGSLLDLYHNIVADYNYPIAFSFWQWTWLIFTAITILAALTIPLKSNSIHNYFYKLYHYAFAIIMIVMCMSVITAFCFNYAPAKVLTGTFVTSFMIHFPIWIVAYVVSWILALTIMPLIYKVFGVNDDKYF